MTDSPENKTGNLIKAVDRAIELLNKFREELPNKNPDSIELRVSQERDVKPFYEMGSILPSGLIQRGSDVISITIADSTNNGKVFT